MDNSNDFNQNTINTLLLNSSFINNLGLMHGKMGISIFFFHLARQTKNKIYEDYAGELIDEIYEEITDNTPVDFENGLAGIGWGIEYLVQNKFIEADTDEVLEEFDNLIFKELIYNTPKEIGLLTGIVGIGAYFLKRVQPAIPKGKNLASNDEKIITLTNKQTLIHLIDEIERQTQDFSVAILETVTISQALELSNNQALKHLNPETKETIKSKPYFDITWNYPVLLWFLSELYKQNILNSKVEKIIQRLLEPLSYKTNLPKLQSNRLLLALALTKLWQTLEHSDNQTLELLNVETITSDLFLGLNRETIKSEILPNNSTIKHGTSGIAWVYKYLFELTKNKQFKQEMEHWAVQSKDIGFEEKINSNLGDSTNHNKTAFGLLEGKVGMLLNHQTINNSNISHNQTFKQENQLYINH
jgi:lantibiotic modifying enzyme